MRFHTPFFSNSTFADGHCKGHNLLLSWRAYMNCVQRRRKHAKNQEGHLLRTHPHSTEFSEVFTRTHPHSHNKARSFQISSALTPHSHLFKHFMNVALIRTHVETNAFSPHSSTLIRTHCAPLHPRRMLNDFRLTRKWADTYQKSLWRLDMPLHGIAYHQPNRWFRYMSRNHKTYSFFCKNHLCKKNIKKHEKAKFHNSQITSRHAPFIKTLTNS